ncbi:MAG TPA: DUF2103 domain-containing protein [Candidatus Paceibacterota bacterium]
MQKPKWQGRKHAGSHTTLIEAAQSLIKEAEELEAVKRISLGYIKATPGTPGRKGVKFACIQGGLMAKVRGNTAIQEIRIYTDFPQEVQEALEAKLTEMEL